MEAYRRLAAVTTPADVDDVRAEWEDRYGPPPPPALALLDVARLRAACLRLGIRAVSVQKGRARLDGWHLLKSQEVRLQRMIARRADPPRRGRRPRRLRPARSRSPRRCSGCSTRSRPPDAGADGPTVLAGDAPRYHPPDDSLAGSAASRSVLVVACRRARPQRLLEHVSATRRRSRTTTPPATTRSTSRAPTSPSELARPRRRTRRSSPNGLSARRDFPNARTVWRRPTQQLVERVVDAARRARRRSTPSSTHDRVSVTPADTTRRRPATRSRLVRRADRSARSRSRSQTKLVDAPVPGLLAVDRTTTQTCPSGRFVVAHPRSATQGRGRRRAPSPSAGRARSFADSRRRSRPTRPRASRAARSGACAPSEFVKEFENAADAAPFGVLTGPVKTQFGYHLILVRKLGPDRRQDQFAAGAAAGSGRRARPAAAERCTCGSTRSSAPGRRSPTQQRAHVATAVTPPAVPAVRDVPGEVAACAPPTTTTTRRPLPPGG